MRDDRKKIGKEKDILFAIGSLIMGGAERQMIFLSEELVARGWNVRVFCLDASGSLRTRLEQAAIPIIDGGFAPRSRSKASVALSVALASCRLLSELLIRRPCIIHGFLPLTNLISAVLGRATFVRLVVTSKRGLGFHQERVPAFKFFDRIANALSHKITANTSEIATDTEMRDGYSAAKVIVIPNGMDFRRFDYTKEFRAVARRNLGLADHEVAIVKVANLIPYKGHPELIEAFSILLQSGLSARLFLIGEDRGIGDLLERNAREFNIASRVCFMGERDDIPELLSAMDVGVVASHEEGLSNALIEMAAAGLPIVATDVGGNNQILRGLPNCTLVPPKKPLEMAEALRNGIERILSGDEYVELRRRLTQQRFSLNEMVDAYERLYLAGR